MLGAHLTFVVQTVWACSPWRNLKHTHTFIMQVTGPFSVHYRTQNEQYLNTNTHTHYAGCSFVYSSFIYLFIIYLFIHHSFVYSPCVCLSSFICLFIIHFSYSSFICLFIIHFCYSSFICLFIIHFCY